MILQILGSGSSGNCYLFETDDGSEALMLEAGIRVSEVKRALDFNLSKLVGCFVTHEHLDHSKYIKELLTASVDVYASAGTIEALALKSHRLYTIKDSVKVKVGSFTITPFNAKHDAKEPLGFIVSQYEMGNTLFLTDSYFVEYKFPHINNMMVECNFSEEILAANIATGRVNPFVAKRVQTSHMSDTTLETMLLANDLSVVNNIVLLHLSDANSNALKFANRIHEISGKSVTVAERNTIMQFNKYPF